MANNQKHPAEPPSSNDSPSPVKKKTLINFDVQQSDNNLVLSGDESDGQEHKEDRVAHLFAKQSKKEDLMDYAAMDCSPVTKVEEWMNIVEETLDAAAGIGNVLTHIALETVVIPFVYLSTTIKSLKVVALECV